MKAIILHNMGGARNENELKEFLYNMFKDRRIINSPIRHILAPLISTFRYKKVWKNYELIGGSRLHEITKSLCEKMKNDKYEVTFAMRYTSPYLKDVISKYNEVVFLPMYPHYSFSTYESSLDDLKECGFKGKTKIIKPFYKKEEYNDIITKKILNSVKNPEEWNLIFSAHGLPVKMIENGDTYEKEIKEHVEILKKRLPQFKSVHLAFQSRFGNSEWLKPYLDDKLKEFKNQKVLIYPISFTIDNSETDLELKIEYRHLAEEMGINEYKVVECPNDDDEMAKFLLKLAEEA